MGFTNMKGGGIPRSRFKNLDGQTISFDKLIYLIYSKDISFAVPKCRVFQRFLTQQCGSTVKDGISGAGDIINLYVVLQHCFLNRMAHRSAVYECLIVMYSYAFGK